MKVWIDVLTPKQALFFSPLHDLLRQGGHQVLLTTRVYREAQQTLRRKRLRALVVGRHGGGTAIGKLIASGKRIVKLAALVDNWKPDVVVSFSSVEAARVAFGLGIPHVAVNDSPHSWMVARLTIPLSAYVCSPWIVREPVWSAFGGREDRVVTYRALDPAAWLKRHRPNPRILHQLKLGRDKPIVVLRTEEAFASYLMGEVSDKTPVIGPVIDELLRLKEDIQIVASTRYGLQAPVLRRRFGGRVKVLDRIVDATSLLSYSSAFVGSGGTMTVEAALMGIPAISCYPGPKPLYIRYLERHGLVKTIKSPREIASEIRKILTEPNRFEAQRRRGRSLLARMEDPSAKILSVVEEAGRR